MKIKLFIAALILAGASACTQKTCPTYAKDDVKPVENKTDKLV